MPAASAPARPTATRCKPARSLQIGRNGAAPVLVRLQWRLGAGRERVGGLTGPLLAGVFATAAIGGTSGLIEGEPKQLLAQLHGVAVTLVWSGGVTWALLKLVSAFVPLRVSREHELEGLDISQHGEALQ
jgi:hypothetical protein